METRPRQSTLPTSKRTTFTGDGPDETFPSIRSLTGQRMVRSGKALPPSHLDSVRYPSLHAPLGCMRRTPQWSHENRHPSETPSIVPPRGACADSNMGSRALGFRVVCRTSEKGVVSLGIDLLLELDYIKKHRGRVRQEDRTMQIGLSRTRGSTAST